MAVSPRQAAPPRYLSGHCNVHAHDRCRGVYAGATCRCACHLTCPRCGQGLPGPTSSPEIAASSVAEAPRG